MVRFSDMRTVYMIGIKGVGMTALAEVLHGWGKKVSGSDTEERFQTDAILRKRAIPFTEGFRAENVPERVDLVVYSTAYNENNPEFAEAKRRGLPMMSYPEALGQLMEGKYGIAIAGSHGKTTTTALLGHVMTEAGLDPTVIVGSEVKNWGANARVGKSDYVVIEADEYQNKFQYYNPKGLLITNIDWDHSDFFKTPEEYEHAFTTFQNKVKERGGWVVEGQALKIEGRLKISVQEEEEYTSVRIIPLPLVIFGEHNHLNISLVRRVAEIFGITEQKFWEAIRNFRGTARRVERKGMTTNKVTIIDDYAHHPSEIRATLRSIRQYSLYSCGRLIFMKKLWVVFHPHTFTRTKTFFEDFARSFSDADQVIVLDIYGSAREAHGGVHSKDLVQIIPERSRGVTALYIPTISEAATYLRDHAHKGDVVLTMGAGDVWKVGELLLNFKDSP